MTIDRRLGRFIKQGLGRGVSRSYDTVTTHSWLNVSAGGKRIKLS